MSILKLEDSHEHAGATVVRLPTGFDGRGTWKDMRRRRMLAASDVLALAVACVAVLLVGGAPNATLFAVLPLAILVAKGCGLYDRDHRRILHRTADEVPSLLHWAVLTAGLSALVLELLRPSAGLSARGVLMMAVVAFGAAIVARATSRFAWRLSVPRDRGLVIGSGQLADALARKLVLEPGHHLELTRRISLGDDGPRIGPRAPVRRTDISALPRLIEESQIDRVIVAVEDLDEATLSEAVRCCRELGVKLSVAPPLRAMLGTAVELSHMAELPLIEFRTWDPSRSTMLLKRTMDVCGSAAGLLLLSPLLTAIAIAIKLDSRGPVLFRQARAGRRGVPFTMVKFRTMVPDAEARLSEVINLAELDEPAFKVKADPRVTRVGRFLRRTSLDELPQLLNVLTGRMSLVGPRPEEVWVTDRYTEAERFRLEMKPGLTGPMQVHGRAELSFPERIAIEREYIDSYCLRRDVEILLGTVTVVFTGRGAF